MVKRVSGWVLVFGSVLSACGGSDEGRPEPADSIEIEGTWTTSFGTEVIDERSWSSDSGTGPTVSEIVEYSNEDNSAVVLSPDDAEYYPGTYGRNVWTEPSDGVFYYCTVSYGKESAEAALSESEPFDDGDPETKGCGAADFAWPKLTRQ